MSSYNVSSRYAKALLDNSIENNSFDKVSDDVQLIFDSLKSSRDLRSVLLSPIIREEKKISILDEIFKSKISTEIMNFLKFVVEKNREDLLVDILRRYIDLKNEKLGILEVGVISGSEMTEDQKKKLGSNLEKRTGKKIILNYSLDDSLIGGFKLKLKDTVIDASVKYQLEKLKKSFIDENMISTN